MFLILAFMSVLNLLTKYTTTPKISFKVFPWPPMFPALSLLCAEIASVFFTGQEMPEWQSKNGLDFNLTLIVVVSTVMCLCVECGNLVNKMLSQPVSIIFICY